MLKLTYTHDGFLIDHLEESLEAWVTTRVILALRAGTSLCVEPSSASFLISLDLPYVDQLLKDVDQFAEEILEVNRCDDEAMEVVLDWRGDKNYQSKAGQAFQGVELKKIEGSINGF